MTPLLSREAMPGDHGTPHPTDLPPAVANTIDQVVGGEIAFICPHDATVWS